MAWDREQRDGGFDQDREKPLLQEEPSDDEKLIWHGSEEERAELVSALAAAMLEFERVINDTEGMIGKRTYAYANLENLVSATRPALLKHGIVPLQFMTGPLGNGNHRLTTFLCRGKASIESRIDYKRQNDLKGWGSQTTYLRRYAYRALFMLDGSDDSDSTDAGRQEPPERRAEPPRPPAQGQGRQWGRAPAADAPTGRQEPERRAPNPPSPAAPPEDGPSSPAQRRAISIGFQRHLYLPESGPPEKFTRATVNTWAKGVLGRAMMGEGDKSAQMVDMTAAEAERVLAALDGLPEAGNA